MIVIKLGGCNGSGKSSVARALIEKVGGAPINPYQKKLDGYAGPWKGREVVVLGAYRTACGGMDGISDKEDRLALLRKYADPASDRIVFYEGLITGKTYGAMGALSDEPEQKGRWLYTFMDTPFEVCVQRVLTRRYDARREKGMGHFEANESAAAFDAERTMRPTFKSVHSTAARAEAEGHRVLWLPHDKTPAQIVAFMMKHVEKML